jgi:ribose/xylose/arabinose/galactoside ABC-type transport system permease subunit
MRNQSKFSKIISIEGVVILAAFVLMVIFFSFKAESFLIPDSIRYYINEAVPIFIIIVGLTFVIIAGGIDLSIGSVLGLSAGTSLMVSMWGWPFWMAVIVGVLTGLAFGLLNAVIITIFKVNDFIVTLGTLYIAAGALTVLTDKIQLIGTKDTNFQRITDMSFLGVTSSIWIALVIIVVSELVLLKSPFGRRIFATGIGEVPALISGINTQRTKFGAYLISGGLAGFGGVLLASHLNSVQSGLAGGYELTAIAGAVLGGISLAGGRGSVWRAIVGALFLTTLNQGLLLMGIDPLIFQIVTGLCILVGVVVDRGVFKFALTFSTQTREVNYQPLDGKKVSS